MVFNDTFNNISGISSLYLNMSFWLIKVLPYKIIRIQTNSSTEMLWCAMGNLYIYPLISEGYWLVWLQTHRVHEIACGWKKRQSSLIFYCKIPILCQSLAKSAQILLVMSDRTDISHELWTHSDLINKNITVHVYYTYFTKTSFA